jgi:serine phosphatase RsbU (regulator of sigma subunit)
LKNKNYILFILLLSLLVSNGYAQKKTKKEYQQQKEALLQQLKDLAAKGQVDSLFHYLRNQKNSIDTSLHVYQSTNQKGGVLEMVVLEGDTLYVYNMASFAVVDLKPYKDKEKDLQFRRLRWHVKKVYPYAITASKKLMAYDEELRKVKSKRKRRKLMKAREKALKIEFEDVIKKMSKTSGRVLVKLIDRETGTSTYDIIKEMRGGFKAWIYQGVGKLYGADLKVRYNPADNEEDEMIERVVQSLIAVEKNGR